MWPWAHLISGGKVDAGNGDFALPMNIAYSTNTRKGTLQQEWLSLKRPEVWLRLPIHLKIALQRQSNQSKSVVDSILPFDRRVLRQRRPGVRDKKER